jgi:hypothetical protein
MNRRNFFKKSSYSALAALSGTSIVFADKIPENYVPLIFQDNDPFSTHNKPSEMSLLNDRPLNMEALAHLLNHS